MKEIEGIMKLFEAKNGITISKEMFIQVHEQFSYHTFNKNEMIYRMGSIDTNIYVITKGIARLYYIDLEGNDITRYFAQEGDIIFGGEHNLPFAVEAIEDVECYKADWNTFREIISEDKNWLKLWNHMLQNAIEYKIYRESCFLMETATQRYLSFRKSYSELEKRVSQAHIASYLGITPVSLSRIRKSIKEGL